MGILKNLTEEYFGNTTREEDLIDIHDLNVEIVSSQIIMVKNTEEVINRKIKIL